MLYLCLFAHMLRQSYFACCLSSQFDNISSHVLSFSFLRQHITHIIIVVTCKLQSNAIYLPQPLSHSLSFFLSSQFHHSVVLFCASCQARTAHAYQLFIRDNISLFLFLFLFLIAHSYNVSKSWLLVKVKVSQEF